MKNAFLILLLILAAFAYGCSLKAPLPEVEVTTTESPSTTTSTTEAINENPGVTSNNSIIILIQDFSFSPALIRIKAWDTVTWLNNDSTAHTIKSSFLNSSSIQQGQSVKFRFRTKGVYDYHCGLHPEMTGQIIVE